MIWGVQSSLCQRLFVCFTHIWDGTLHFPVYFRLLRTPLQPLRAQVFGERDGAGNLRRDPIVCLSQVGLNKVPSWLRPFRLLSNGEQQRVLLAANICSDSDVTESARAHSYILSSEVLSKQNL